MIIRRSAGKTAIQGTYFSSWRALSKDIGLDYDQLARQCVFSDLSLGAWRGHWIGREIFQQLECDFPERPQSNVSEGRENDPETGIIAQLIDNEGRGDLDWLFSHSLALQILKNINKKRMKWIVIIAPIIEMDWGRENVQLIGFLAQGCRDVGCDLLLVAADGASLSFGHGKWDMRWLGSPKEDQHNPETDPLYSVPGIIPLRLGENVSLPSDSLTLSNGSLLLSPLKRDAVRRPLREILSDFITEPSSPQCEWLAAFIYADEKCDDGEAGFLIRSAAHRADEGGLEIGLRLLEKAKIKTSDEFLQTYINLQRQSFLIRSRKFEAAAAGPLPPEGLPDRLKASLYQSKATGLVMTNKPVEAEEYFERARASMGSHSDSKGYLYLLNTSALNKLRIGAAEEALAYEKIIEEKLRHEKETDWHATYINSLNFARLYKKLNDLKTSELYYAKAFSITDNLRSESDLLYTNLCRAQLEEKKGQFKKSFFFWLRAAIHWLSNPVPEALAPRVIQAVTQTDQLSDDFIDDISFRLAGYLKEAAVKADMSFVMTNFGEGDAASQCPSFARIDSFPQHPVQFAVGNDGWSVFVGYKSLPLKYNGFEYCELSKLTYEFIRQLSGIHTWPDGGALLTDHQFGCDLPATVEELIGSCLRYQVGSIRYGDREFELDEREINSLRAHSNVRLANGVKFIERRGDSSFAYFKRYFKPLELSALESDIINKLTETHTVEFLAAQLGDAHSYGDVCFALAGMEKKHLLRIETVLRQSS